MNEIRPPSLPTLPNAAGAPTPSSGRSAAQRAFFAAALDQPQAAAAPVRAAAPQPAARTAAPALSAPVQTAVRVDPRTVDPSRPLRPGSLLDIRV